MSVQLCICCGEDTTDNPRLCAHYPPGDFGVERTHILRPRRPRIPPSEIQYFVIGRKLRHRTQHQPVHGRVFPPGDELLAQLEISTAGDGLFETEIAELPDEAGRGGAAAEAIATRLRSVTAILAVSVLWQEQTAEQTLDLLLPLWEWLLANRRGLIHADGEGFYEGQDLVLATG